MSSLLAESPVAGVAHWETAKSAQAVQRLFKTRFSVTFRSLFLYLNLVMNRLPSHICPSASITKDDKGISKGNS